MEAATFTHAPDVRMLSLSVIDPSPNNPRKTFWGIAELAAQVKEKGVLVPLIVRPFGDRFELVAGERRLRAAKKAGLEGVPAIVRELDDQSAREIQLHENLDRSDLSPVEEADAFASLQKDFGFTVEDLAAKFKRSKRAIWASLQLRALGPAARAALLDQKLNASVALLIARIPGEDLQARAVLELAASDQQDAVSYRDAQHIIQRNFMLPLERAEFDTTDALLVPAAGPCSTCPKRTGNQRELFAEVKSADVCTDPACFRSKTDALVAIKFEKAENEGRKVLHGKAAEKVFDKHGQIARGYVLATGSSYVEGRGFVDVAKLAPAEARVLVQEPVDGKAIEVVPVQALPPPKKKAEGRVKKLETPAQKEKRLAEEKAAHEKEARALELVEALVAHVEKKFGKTELLAIAHGLAEQFTYDNLPEAVARRAGKKHLAGVAGSSAFVKSLAKMSEAQLRGVVFELAVCSQDARIDLQEVEEGPIVDAAKALGVKVSTKKPAKK